MSSDPEGRLSVSLRFSSGEANWLASSISPLLEGAHAGFALSGSSSAWEGSCPAERETVHFLPRAADCLIKSGDNEEPTRNPNPKGGQAQKGVKGGRGLS